jgi:uncharacterized protein YjiK
MPLARQILGCLLVLAACRLRPGLAEPPTTTDTLWTHARNIDRVGFREPSGICYHTLRGTLFVVGDKGDVGEMNRDGAFLRTTRLRQGDLEGITHDPAGGLLYVAVEGAEDILELDPDTLAILRTFSIPRKLNGRTVLQKGRGGIEAIAFVPDPAHPEGGTFFVGNQSLDPSSQDDLSAVFEVEVPLKTKTKAASHAKLLRCFDAGIDDISDLHYDSASDRLYLISDKANKLVALSRTGKRLQVWDLPGDKQEGFTMDSHGYVYIAQDSGGIRQLSWRDIPQASAP